MKYILVADDEPMNLGIIKIILMDDYEIKCVENGVECLESIEGRMPDLLLLDFAMPEMGGIEVSKSLRSNEKTKNLPIVMISGYASEEHIKCGYEAGINDYITKPYKSEQLLNVVKKHL